MRRYFSSCPTPEFVIGASSTSTRTQILNRIHKNKKNLACCSRIVAKIVRGKGSDFVAIPEYLVHLLLVSWRIRSRVQFEAVTLTVNDYHFIYQYRAYS